MTASNIFVFWCSGDSLLSRLIKRITRSPWSHCGIGFAISDPSNPSNRSTIYFEALFAKGFRGPRLLSELYAWRDRRPGREIAVVTLDVPAAFAQAKLAIAESWVGRVGYAEWQIVCLWAFLRFGLRVPRSPDRVVCCEAIARLLQPELDLTDPAHPTADETTPGSVYAAVQRWLADRTQEAASIHRNLLFDATLDRAFPQAPKNTPKNAPGCPTAVSGVPIHRPPPSDRYATCFCKNATRSGASSGEEKPR